LFALSTVIFGVIVLIASTSIRILEITREVDDGTLG